MYIALKIINNSFQKFLLMQLQSGSTIIGLFLTAILILQTSAVLQSRSIASSMEPLY